MRAWCLVVLLLPLGGCGSLVCDLVGAFAGTFEGDASGDLAVDVTENPDDDSMADVAITLTNPDLTAAGGATVSCADGKFSLDLSGDDGSAIGDLSGTLRSDGGDGEWSFTTGESGTWSFGVGTTTMQ